MVYYGACQRLKRYPWSQKGEKVQIMMNELLLGWSIIKNRCLLINIEVFALHMLLDVCQMFLQTVRHCASHYLNL